MELAFSAASFATCDRRHVGCVVVKDDDRVGIGFNTSPTGTPTCEEADHIMVNGSCKRTVHAEINACLNGLRIKGNLVDATVYVTDQPCADCLKFMANLGIAKVYYVREYPVHYEFEHEIQLTKVEYSVS